MTLILAHGIGGRSDLPVPLWLALYGAAAAVVVSFVALAAFWLTPKFKGDRAGRPLPEPLERFVDARGTRVALRAVGVVLFLFTIATAAFGEPNPNENPAPTLTYVWFWVGLVPASILFGPVWRAMNPLRAVSAGLARLTGDPEEKFVRPLPAGLGYWPAAVSLLAFVWLELVYLDAAEPTTVLVFVAVYSLVHVAAANAYGSSWYARGDGFEVYSSLFGRMSPFGRRRDGRLVVRNPLDGLAALRSEPGLIAVVCVILGSTAFDGLTRTRFWTDLTRETAGLENALLGTLGLAAGIGFIALTYTAAVRLSGRLAGSSINRSAGASLRGLFVHSLVPIALGYTIAHYFSLFVFQGQAGYILASDPLGSGRNLFGTAEWSIDYAIVGTRAIALVQVAAIVAGHITGVVVAHDRAVGVFSGRDKTRAQYALLAVMVMYTVGGIALLVGA